MCIFQSEQLIELRFWLKITSLMFKSPDLNPLDYHVRYNTEMLYTPKPTNIAELKSALLQYGMIWHTPITHLQSSYNQPTWLPTQSYLCSVYR